MVIEDRVIDHVDRGGIVVAEHEELGFGPNSLKDFSGLWAVSHDIAEADDHVGFLRSQIGEDSFPSTNVGVEVRDDGVAHGKAG